MGSLHGKFDRDWKNLMNIHLKLRKSKDLSNQNSRRLKKIEENQENIWQKLRKIQEISNTQPKKLNGIWKQSGKYHREV